MSEGPAQTVLFEGGPATGPWQQLGTVAEITHPDAPETARFSYTNFWSDPNEENQSDELWDRLVQEVTSQLSELGSPIDRPLLDSAEGTEAFNASGGVQDIYFEEGAFTAQWNARLVTPDGDAIATIAYLLSFNREVIDTMPTFVILATPDRTNQSISDESVTRMREWADERGFSQCDGCS